MVLRLSGLCLGAVLLALSLTACLTPKPPVQYEQPLEKMNAERRASTARF